MPDANSHPLVSVVIPVYNGSDFLAEAIESALAQTWPNFEIVVVNDGSQDGGRTAQVAARFGDRIRYFEKPNGGVATALNYGIRRMRGNYLSWLSHDDVYAPDKIERIMAAVLRYDEPVVAFGDCVLIDEKGGFLRELRWGRGFDERQSLWAVLESRINGCTMIVPRQCFDVCGYLHPDLPSTQDYDLWFRMALRFRFIHVPGVMVYQRQHPNQGSKSERFADEVDLLWASMIDRTTREAMTRHTPSDAAFYQKALRGTPNLPGSMALIERRARELAKPVSVTGITLQARSLTQIMGVIDSARDAGVHLVETVSPMPDGEKWCSAELTGADGSCLKLDLVRLPETGSLADQLERLCARAEGELVRLTSGEFANVDPWAFWPALLLSRSPGAVACVLSAPYGGVQQGKLGVLEGAAVRRSALRAALEQCGGGSSSSLAHALSRLGPILASPAEQYWQPPVEVPVTPERRPPPPPVAPTAKTRLVALLSRFSLLNKVAVAGLWKLWGGGAEARERLLRLHGIEGCVDADWYRQRYRDVAASSLDPTLHYLLFGSREGRDPSPGFDAKAYVTDYPDVWRRRLNPVQHYVLWGAREHRRALPARPGAEIFPDARSDGRPALLLVLDPNNSDMKRFARDLSRQLTRRIRILFLSHTGAGIVSLSLDEGAQRGRAFRLPLEGDALKQEADALDLRRILVLHGMGFEGVLQDLLERLGRPFDMVHLNREFGAAAKPPDPKPGVTQNGYHPAAPPLLLDPESDWLARNAATHLACSTELAEFLTSRGIPGQIDVAPPPDPYYLRRFRVWPRPLEAGESLRIAILGRVDEAHGLDMVLAAMKEAAKDDLPLRFCFFGESPAIPADALELATVIPCPDMRALTIEICSRSPHLAWFPWEVPESCAYALTDAESCGLPVAATAVGSLPERLHARPLSWTLPPGSGVQDWLGLFLRLRTEGMRADDAPVDPDQRAADDQRIYERRLIEAVFGKENSTAPDARAPEDAHLPA